MIQFTKKAFFGMPSFRLSKKLRRIFRASEKRNPEHFPSGRVPDGKYISGCKCGICTPRAYKLCAQQTAKKLAEKPVGVFRQAQRGHSSECLLFCANPPLKRHRLLWRCLYVPKKSSAWLLLSGVRAGADSGSQPGKLVSVLRRWAGTHWSGFLDFPEKIVS